MIATAIPAFVAALNPESPFGCVDIESVGCIGCIHCVPLKPSYIVLLSGTVILQTHYWLPRDDGPLLHSHEGINVQTNAEWVADNDLVFPGFIKPGARVRHKLCPLGITADPQTPCLGRTVNCDLVFGWFWIWYPIRNEVNCCAVEFERRQRLSSGVARGKIKTFECGTTLRGPCISTSQRSKAKRAANVFMTPASGAVYYPWIKVIDSDILDRANHQCAGQERRKRELQGLHLRGWSLVPKEGS